MPSLNAALLITEYALNILIYNTLSTFLYNNIGKHSNLIKHKSESTIEPQKNDIKNPTMLSKVHSHTTEVLINYKSVLQISITNLLNISETLSLINDRDVQFIQINSNYLYYLLLLFSKCLLLISNLNNN